MRPPFSGAAVRSVPNRAVSASRDRVGFMISRPRLVLALLSSLFLLAFPASASAALRSTSEPEAVRRRQRSVWQLWDQRRSRWRQYQRVGGHGSSDRDQRDQRISEFHRPRQL